MPPLLHPRNRPSGGDAEVSWLGVVARSAFPAGPSPEPVAVAAGSPLTVAGAAPVLHRTSLSHRVGHASTPRHEQPTQTRDDFAARRESTGKNLVSTGSRTVFRPASHCNTAAHLANSLS